MHSFTRLLKDTTPLVRVHLFYLTVFLLPTQLGYHFWPSFDVVDGIRLDYLSPTLYVTDILICLQLLLILPNASRLVQQKKFSHNWYLIIGFLAVVLVGVISSVNKGAGFYGVVRLIEMGFFGLLVKNVVTKKNINHVLMFLMGAVLYESILAIAQFFHQGALGGPLYFLGERMIVGNTPGAANASLNGALVLRPYGTFSHPNTLAGFLVISGMLLFLRRTKKFQLTVLILTTLGILISLSRAAIVVWFVFLVIQLIRHILQSTSRVKSLTFQLVMFLSMIFLGIMFFSADLFFRFSQLRLSDESVVERVQLTKAALAMISFHPLFGVGLNSFFNQLVLLSASDNRFPLQPVHNIFLLIASETGLLGLFLSVYFLIKSFLHTKHETIRMIILSISALGMVDHYFLTSQQGLLIFAFVLGLAWARF